MRKTSFRTKNGIVICTAIYIALLLCAEIMLQVRAHYRYGNSMFTKLLYLTKSEGTKPGQFLINEQFNLLMLRPNATVSGSQSTIVSNSLGLRSPEITKDKPGNSFRFAVLGASTVMGAAAKTNQDTFSYMIDSNLQRIHPTIPFSFLNAGIAGYDSSAQVNLYNRVVAPFNPDLLIIYTGVMDFSQLCSSTNSSISETGGNSFEMPIPKWVMTYDLITKNTLWSNPSNAELLSPEAIKNSANGYKKNIVILVNEMKSKGGDVIVMGNAKSYRPEMPIQKQLELSALASFHYPCMKLPELYLAYSEYNQALADIADKYGIIYIDTESLVPGGDTYFVDPVHFTKQGETIIAKGLSEQIEEILISKGIVN